MSTKNGEPAAKPAKGKKAKADKKARAAKKDFGLKPGQTIKRVYKDKEIVVHVVEGGFKYEGEVYKSLTALAKKATGYPAISGPLFFGLVGAKAKADAS